MKKFLFSAVAFLPLLAAAQNTTVNPDQPSEVVVTPYKTTMVADGKDKALIKISVINKQGNTVTNATNLIHFTMEGDAKIVSITNGADSPHDPGSMLEEKLNKGELRI